MTIGQWIIWLIGVLLALLATWGITKISERVQQQWGWKILSGIFFTFFFFSLLQAGLSSRIIVITNYGSSLAEKTTYAFFVYDNNSITPGETYVDNQTSNTLILYPVYYGKGQTPDYSEGDGQRIDFNTFERLKANPDFIFEEPMMIATSEKESTFVKKWILDSYSNIYNRYNGFL